MVSNLLQNDGRETYLNFKKVKDNILEMILTILLMTLVVSGFLLMMVFLCSGGQHPRLLRLLIQRRTSFKPSLCLTKSYRLLKIGINRLKKKYV